MSRHLGSIHSSPFFALSVLGSWGCLRRSHTPVTCCKFMASNFSGVLDEASCYMSSVSSSPRLSPLTSFSHLPYPSLLRRGQCIIQPFPLSLFDTKEYMSVFSRAILGPITCILLSPLPWQLFLFHSFSFFSSLTFLPRNIKYSHLFHLKKKNVSTLTWLHIPPALFLCRQACLLLLTPFRTAVSSHL